MQLFILVLDLVMVRCINTELYQPVNVFMTPSWLLRSISFVKYVPSPHSLFSGSFLEDILVAKEAGPKFSTDTWNHPAKEVSIHKSFVWLSAGFVLLFL